MAKKPKYGYRRNIYGNIYKEDQLQDENAPVNEYHDNSDYDPEDDNDSLYSMFY